MSKWYFMNIEEIYKELNIMEEGLSSKEAISRLKRAGYNELPKKKKDSVFKIFFKQLLDPIVMLLVITVIFSFIIGEIVDAIAIIFIILIDLIMGTFQEWKAEKNAESLQNLMKDQVKVIRDGKQIEIDSKELVLGDIVLLESGDKISADLRILESNNLQVDESVLTGESVNVFKNNDVLIEDVPLAERKNILYAGTSVVTGRGKGIVVEVSTNTEIGKIAETVVSSKDEKSPLTIRMDKFSKQISLLVIIIAIIITLVLFSKNVPGSEIFLSVIALSVSAMPEGLPLALTMALTIASNKMMKHNVIVKKLNSVESLGSCTIIATDKTGTLTVNEQTAKKIILPNGNQYDVTGTGYNEEGKIVSDNLDDIQNIVTLGAINNEAVFEKKDNKYIYNGDSIDIAFLVLKNKAHINTDDIKIIGKIPYESENKYSAVFYEINNKKYCTVKGSPEVVLNFSNNMRFENNLNEEMILNQNEELASNGYRVIALASSEVKDFKEKNYYDEKDINDLTFEGLVGFIDPVREEAKIAAKECHKAGIKVLMITGDHPLTALSIAKEINVASNILDVATGDDIKNEYLRGQESFDKFIQSKSVFARVTPMDKLKIVESLKRNGEFVAVTGDGVNDAPAIKVANIGIAMGSGTDVAKETADMIILDDNFNSIVSGIKEGRTAYSNIRKVSYMLLSCGIAEVLFFLLSIIFDLPMPLVAIQLLWLNIVTDGLQDFALSFEKSEPDIMSECPRSPKEALFNKMLFKETFVAGISIGLLVFLVWSCLINVFEVPVDIARGYIMALMVFIQNVHVLNCRSEKRSIFHISIKSNAFIIISISISIVLQIIVMEVDFLSTFLQTTTIPFWHLIILFLMATIILFIMELFKKIQYKKD